VSTDVSGAQTAMCLWGDGYLHGYQPDPEAVVATRPGWPVECVLGLADRAQPHDCDLQPYLSPAAGVTCCREHCCQR
jgi:hypothetical protein